MIIIYFTVRYTTIAIEIIFRAIKKIFERDSRSKHCAQNCYGCYKTFTRGTAGDI